MVDLDRARGLFSSKQWRPAYEGFLAVDATDPLEVDDLERMALAAELVGEDTASAAAWERAHLLHLEHRDAARAVRCAFWAGFGFMTRGHMAQAGGWIARASRLVDEHELDTAERWLVRIPVALRRLGDDPQQSLEIFEDVTAAGRRFGDIDVEALGRLGRGRALVILGRDEEGVAALDDAMVSVTAGQVSPTVAGVIYCAVILVCQRACDLPRAHEWTVALDEWCATQPDLVPFRGQCLVHRSQLRQWSGDWQEAMHEAERARERLSEPAGQPAIGMAFYQLGELNRLRGRFEEADAAYREASRSGRTPEPGMSLLRLSQGDVHTAARSVRDALAEPADRLTRAQVLLACAEILTSLGDQPGAADAASELATLASEVDAPVLDAMTAHAAATVALAGGDPAGALGEARRALAAWSELGSPYDRARATAICAAAHEALGDHDAAAFEAESAREVFERLGARPDLDRLVTDPSRRSAPPDELTDRQKEVLALVAEGMTNRQIAAALFISPHTVRRHLQNIFNRVGVTSRSASIAWAYEHGVL